MKVDFRTYVKETEIGYPHPSVTDNPEKGEYSYIKTECGNEWYSVNTDPMKRDGCICPNCMKIIKISESYKEWRKEHRKLYT